MLRALSQSRSVVGNFKSLTLTSRCHTPCIALAQLWNSEWREDMPARIGEEVPSRTIAHRPARSRSFIPSRILKVSRITTSLRRQRGGGTASSQCHQLFWAGAVFWYSCRSILKVGWQLEPTCNGKTSSSCFKPDSCTGMATANAAWCGR